MTRKPKDKFAFWPSDWIGGTASMSPAERGVYIDLLCCQWSEGPLTNEQALAAGRAEVRLIETVLRKKFHRNPDGTWQNNRLEQERRRRKATALPIQQNRAADVAGIIPGLESTVDEKTPQAANARLFLIFPCRGEPRSWALDHREVEGWQALYPGLDVPGEMGKALAWVQANGGKTSKGMLRFLVSWLNRAADKSGARTEPATFRQRDNDERRRVRVKLKLEAMGIGRDDAARLANLDEESALTEAKRLLNKPKAITSEEIPW